MTRAALPPLKPRSEREREQIKALIDRALREKPTSACVEHERWLDNLVPVVRP